MFVACPPLFRIDAEAVGKKRPAQKVYAMDEAELTQLQDKFKKDGYSKLKVGRFKGLGEMDPPELWETTLCPDTRKLKRVVLPENLRAVANLGFDNLMSKGKADWRKQWLERRCHEVEGY